MRGVSSVSLSQPSYEGDQPPRQLLHHHHQPARGLSLAVRHPLPLQHHQEHDQVGAAQGQSGALSLVEILCSDWLGFHPQ